MYRCGVLTSPRPRRTLQHRPIPRRVITLRMGSGRRGTLHRSLRRGSRMVSPRDATYPRPESPDHESQSVSRSSRGLGQLMPPKGYFRHRRIDLGRWCARAPNPDEEPDLVGGLIRISRLKPDQADRTRIIFCEVVAIYGGSWATHPSTLPAPRLIRNIHWRSPPGYDPMENPRLSLQASSWPLCSPPRSTAMQSTSTLTTTITPVSHSEVPPRPSPPCFRKPSRAVESR